jgi:excisionase family DNA binding protein
VKAAHLKPATRPEVPRLALSRSEAADALGVSVDFLEQHVLHDLRMVRRGRRLLIPLSELQRWIESNTTVRSATSEKRRRQQEPACRRRRSSRTAARRGLRSGTRGPVARGTASPVTALRATAPGRSALVTTAGSRRHSRRRRPHPMARGCAC